jgi:hypothetical protein
VSSLGLSLILPAAKPVGDALQEATLLEEDLHQLPREDQKGSAQNPSQERHGRDQQTGPGWRHRDLLWLEHQQARDRGAQRHDADTEPDEDRSTEFREPVPSSRFHALAPRLTTPLARDRPAGARLLTLASGFSR